MILGQIYNHMSKTVITIIGSTGNIGTELVNILSSAEIPTRAVLRNINKVRPLPFVTWMQADVSDEHVLDAVLAGTDHLFILTGNAPGFGQIQTNLIHLAKKHGVKHIVKISALGASPRTKSPLAYEHWQVEQELEKSGLSWTILRPHVFMQNWLEEIAETVKNENTIYAAIGEGRIPFIDARDIAAVAANALLNPDKHTQKLYTLTGNEAIGYQDLADALTKAIGRPINYHALSTEEMRIRMKNKGMSDKMIESYLALAAYQKAGGPTERVTDDVSQILGQSARTVVDFANDYKKDFI